MHPAWAAPGVRQCKLLPRNRGVLATPKVVQAGRALTDPAVCLLLLLRFPPEPGPLATTHGPGFFARDTPFPGAPGDSVRRSAFLMSAVEVFLHSPAGQAVKSRSSPLLGRITRGCVLRATVLPVSLRRGRPTAPQGNTDGPGPGERSVLMPRSFMGGPHCPCRSEALRLRSSASQTPHFWGTSARRPQGPLQRARFALLITWQHRSPAAGSWEAQSRCFISELHTLQNHWTWAIPLSSGCWGAGINYTHFPEGEMETQRGGTAHPRAQQQETEPGPGRGFLTGTSHRHHHLLSGRQRGVNSGQPAWRHAPRGPPAQESRGLSEQHLDC